MPETLLVTTENRVMNRIRLVTLARKSVRSLIGSTARFVKSFRSGNKVSQFSRVARPITIIAKETKKQRSLHESTAAQDFTWAILNVYFMQR